MKKLALPLLFWSALVTAQVDCTSYDDCFDKGTNDPNYENGLVYLTKSIEMWTEEKPVSWLSDSYSARGERYMALGSRGGTVDETYLSKAEADANKAIELDPTLWLPYYIKGYLCVLRQQGWDAINAHFMDAMVADPSQARPGIVLSGLYMEWKNYDKAFEFVNMTIDRLPDRSFETNAEGKETFKLKIGDTSVPMADRAQMYAYRGKIYLDHKKDQQAGHADMYKAYSLDPSNYMALSNLGKIYYGYDKERSLQMYLELAQKHPDKGEGYFWSGMAYYGKQDYNRAVQLFTQAAQVQPDVWGDGYAWASTVHNILGNWDATIQTATQAINVCKYKEDVATAYFNRGYAYWQKAQTSYTIADFKKAVDNGHQQAREYLRSSFSITY